PSVYGIPGIIDGSSGPWSGIHSWVHLTTVTHTYVPNPRWVLETFYANNTYRWGASNPDDYNKNRSSQLGLKGTLIDATPSMSFAGYSGTGGTSFVNFGINPHGQHSFGQRFVHDQGRHALKFGYEYTQIHQDCCDLYIGGALNFGSEPTMLPPGAA